jgi:two-component system nitrate/nitrite response regulator NarL
MSLKLLLVDDHELFMNGLQSIFQREIGIEVIGTVTNGFEALKFIDIHTPDVVLTDIRMPILDGVSLVKQLAESHPNIPVIALSMFDQDADIIEMLDAGAKGYVLKKSNSKALISAINTVAKGELYFSEEFKTVYEHWKKNKDIHVEKVNLTRRERQVLELVVKGRSSLQIAETLNLSRYTVDTHRKNIHKKTGIKSNVDLVRLAGDWL